MAERIHDCRLNKKMVRILKSCRDKKFRLDMVYDNIHDSLDKKRTKEEEKKRINTLAVHSKDCDSEG